MQTLPYPNGGDHMREFDVVLAVVVDSLYRDRGTYEMVLLDEELRPVKNESVLQIRPLGNDKC